MSLYNLFIKSKKKEIEGSLLQKQDYLVRE